VVDVKRRSTAPVAAMLAVAFVLVGAYAFGTYSGVKQLWPVSALKRLAHPPVKGAIVTDRLGRLIEYPGKQLLPCPLQTPDTAVLLVAGQSNSGNHQGQKYKAIDARVVEFFDGRCYAAESPLLGSTGETGESSTLLGNKLVEAGLYRPVVIVPAAVGPSAIHRWATGGDLNAMLMSVIDQAKPVYAITQVLWHQGESDFLEDTPGDRYAADFHSLADSLRADGVAAPVYVSVASFMGYVKPWVSDNPTMLAQRSLPDGKTIFAGPDTDTITISDRFGGIHFSARGQERLATLWLDALRASKQPAR